MKKMWKNRSGVSPVIATILMVAITVVLAAVLYVMVMGLGGGTIDPVASLSASTTSGDLEEQVEIASISKAAYLNEMKASFVIGGTVYSATVAADMTSALGMPSGYSVTFVDIAGDGKVSTGDYFLVVSPSANIDIAINLLYGEDAASIGSISWTSM